MKAVLFLVAGIILGQILLIILRKCSICKKFSWRNPLIWIGGAVVIVLIYFVFYKSPFIICTNTPLEEDECVFEIPIELIGKWQMPVYIKNKSEEAKIVYLSYNGEKIPIVYREEKGAFVKEGIKERTLDIGDNGPFWVDTNLLYGVNEYTFEFEIEPLDKKTKGKKQEIKLIRQPWSHFSRAVESNWVEAGEEFKVEVQTTNYGTTSDFYVTWEIYKIDTNIKEGAPWDYKSGMAFIDIGQIRKGETKSTYIENTENEYFKINEPGLYYIKTYVFKNLLPYLNFKGENLGETKRRLKDIWGIEVWEASDPHQMVLIYVMPRNE
jgi:hypothetical protein